LDLKVLFVLFVFQVYPKEQILQSCDHKIPAAFFVYSMPEVAGVGLTEEQCRSQGLDYVVGRSDLSLIPRGAIAGHGGILMLIFNKKDRRLLGVHCFGDIASELVGIGQMVIHFNGSIDTFLEVTLNTPTYTYAYKYAAIDGIRKLDNVKQKH
jgi:NAD(P) transhydrogenase